ncbi:MAG TPA: hypothetical protein VEX57_07760 [Microlunatus sp.]|nr:hypothetical protein [Microlunatus sp.]
MEPLTPEEERLLADLKDALLAAQHPQKELIIANAQDAFGYLTMEEELARLVYDSMLEGDPVGSARAADTSRMVIFECEAMTMEMEIRGRDIVGQIGPPGPATVILETADGAMREVHADDLGCFSARVADPGGPLRFRVSRPGSSAITEWTFGPGSS